MEQKLYRVFRLGCFLEMLNERRNTLVRPALWGDPWEEWWSGIFRMKAGTSLPADVFGQCWTAVEESDAIWRVHAPLNDGVKITPTYRDLCDSLNDATSKGHVEGGIIVEVNYKTDSELSKAGREHITNLLKSMEEKIEAFVVLATSDYAWDTMHHNQDVVPVG
jgi:hypothetical protein